MSVSPASMTVVNNLIAQLIKKQTKPTMVNLKQDDIFVMLDAAREVLLSQPMLLQVGGIFLFPK
jgi:hypothetical protein